MTKLTALLVILGLAWSGTTAATEPLHDHIIIDGKSGPLLPDDCCWVELPPSESLDEERLAGMECSAIGGPVGNFALVGKVLTLVSLRGCGGEIPLQRVYPEAREPLRANWLSGQFTALLGPPCRDPVGTVTYSTKVKLTVRSGEVVASESAKPGAGSCSEP